MISLLFSIALWGVVLSLRAATGTVRYFRGVFVGGGIAPKIASRLRSGAFLEAFFAKGRMRPLLESMPVRVIPSTAVRLARKSEGRTRTGTISARRSRRWSRSVDV